MTESVTRIEERGYANPSALVSTEWVEANLSSNDVIFVESNEDPLLYSSGHIPGAYEVDWTRDLNDPLTRDYLQQDGFENLMGRIGATENSLIVLYGDKSNWWATYALWFFQLFGHKSVRIMDGGRQKWVAENRPLTREKPAAKSTTYRSQARDDRGIRIFRDEVLQHVKASGKLIDVRSPQEFTGERLHMEAYPNEGALRGGHIPGAKNVPWAKAVNEDGTFKSAEELRQLYEAGAGLSSAEDVVVYCRIGERSSHTWFALSYLLGYPRVRNYDGSWTEWGNLVGVPIEKP